MEKINIFDMIDHITNFGKDYDMYKIYFKDGSTLVLTEKQFVEQDKLYKGELAIRVIN